MGSSVSNMPVPELSNITNLLVVLGFSLFTIFCMTTMRSLLPILEYAAWLLNECIDTFIINLEIRTAIEWVVLQTYRGFVCTARLKAKIKSTMASMD